MIIAFVSFRGWFSPPIAIELFATAAIDIIIFGLLLLSFRLRAIITPFHYYYYFLLPLRDAADDAITRHAAPP
jgi:hypothetical protein